MLCKCGRSSSTISPYGITCITPVLFCGGVAGGEGESKYCRGGEPDDMANENGECDHDFAAHCCKGNCDLVAHCGGVGVRGGDGDLLHRGGVGGRGARICFLGRGGVGGRCARVLFLDLGGVGGRGSGSGDDRTEDESVESRGV